MTKAHIIRAGIISALFILSSGVTFADTAIHLHVESPTSVIYDGALSVAPCAVTTDPATTTISGKCALEQAGLSPVWNNFGGDDFFLSSAGGATEGGGSYWGYWADLSYGSDALNKHILHDGENLLVALGLAPLKVESPTLTPVVGATTTVTISQFFDGSFNPVWSPASGATLHVGAATVTTDVNGHADVAVSATSTLFATKTGYVQSDSITLNPRHAQAVFRLRDGSTLVGPFTVDLADPGTSAVALSATGTSTVHTVAARSALAALTALDTSSSDFAVTDLQYFDSFSSYLVNCVSIPSATSSPECGNWSYAVNGSFPLSGMDQYILGDGDVITLFFNAAQWQVSTDKSTVAPNESFVATALKYDPLLNSYAASAGEAVGAVTFDSFFNPTSFASGTTDGSGHVTLAVGTEGTYSVGVASTGYFPSTNVSVQIPFGGGGSGGGNNPPAPQASFNVPSALAYLSANQHTDGSFGSPVYTDWAAVAFGAVDPGAAKAKLVSYLKSASPALSSVTDYERHAMALEALGINPYTGTATDYIAPIVNAFDGTQIGSASLDNDDIFALFPLTHAGYSSNDSIIQKEAAFILSRQKPDGSWDESADLTGAAIQALGPLYNISGVNGALGHAAGYLASVQQTDGGWGTIDSTSWVQSAINGIIEAHTPHLETEAAWATSGGKLPTDALATAQQSDGAARPSSDSLDNRVWSTSYAVAAASGKSWLSILQSFSKPVTPEEGGAGAVTTVNISATSTTATSTLPVATSTPVIATTTAQVTPDVSVTTQTHETKKIFPKSAVAPKKSVVKPATTTPEHASSTPTDTTRSKHTASAASAAKTGIVRKMWSGIVSFFSHLF